MEILKLIVYGIMASFLFLVSFGILINLLVLLDSLAKYFISKKQALDLRTHHDNYIKLSDKTNATVAVINLINVLVTQEVEVILKSYASLGEAYNISKADEDIKTVAEKVYRALKSDFYTNNEILLTDDYIMIYISEQTSLTLFSYIKELNNIAKLT